MNYLRQTLTLALLALSFSANASEMVLTPGTYKKTQGNCCSKVEVYASNSYTLIVLPSGRCKGMLQATYNCQEGICKDAIYGEEVVAIRSPTSFEDFSNDVGACKFQRQ